MREEMIPLVLKKWFVLHFVVDIVFAIPLFFFPSQFLTLLKWQAIDPFATRIVAAALFAIGIESFLGRNADALTYKQMLNLKIIWSGAVVAGMLLSIYQTPLPEPITQWLVLIVFLGFHFIWLRWRIKIGRMVNMAKRRNVS